MLASNSPPTADSASMIHTLTAITEHAAAVARLAEELKHLIEKNVWLSNTELATYSYVIAENAGDLYGDARAAAYQLGLGIINIPFLE